MSLTATGMASLDIERGLESTQLATVKTNLRGHARLALILRRVTAAARTHDVVAIEGMAFGAKGNAVMQIAGLWTMTRHALWEMQKPVVVISPATRAKYATGKGSGEHAAKPHVFRSVRELWPTLDVRDHNQGDALLLAMIGARVAGVPMDETPDSTRWTAVNGLRYATDPT